MRGLRAALGGEGAFVRAGTRALPGAPCGPRGRRQARLGLRGADGRLAGVVDVVRDYPAAREWFLGLLLLLPSARGRGLGERAYRAVEAWARAQGAVAIWLAVLDQNPRARRFWERLGFSAVDRRRVRNGGLESDSVRMVRRLDGSV